MDEKLKIYFTDLTDLAQDELLDFYGINHYTDLNFDTQPVFILEREEDEPEDN